MYKDTGKIALAQLKVEDESITNLVNTRAVDYAATRSAELVGKRVLDDGTVVDNPDAEWSITESTRDSLRSMIADGLKTNIGREEIAQNIENSFAFSEDRASMIAHTEISMANANAALNSYKAAAGLGLKLKKSWVCDAEACDECVDNQDDGPIELDETFSSGDDTNPAHPNCECFVVSVEETEDGDEVETDDEGEGD